MTKRQREKIRKQLKDKLVDLNGFSAQRSELIAERVNDPMDQIQSRQDLDLTVRTIDTSWRTSKAVKTALKLLESGEYGTCQDCGQPINPKRLEAIAWTTLCVKCQEEADLLQAEYESGSDFKRAA